MKYSLQSLHRMQAWQLQKYNYVFLYPQYFIIIFKTNESKMYKIRKEGNKNKHQHNITGLMKTNNILFLHRSQYHVSPQQDNSLFMFGNKLKTWQRRHKPFCQLNITTYIYCEVNILNHTYHIYTRDSLLKISGLSFKHAQAYRNSLYLQADPQY